MAVFLGIDYGLKHVGLAVAATFVAEPLEVVPTAMVMDRIKELLVEYSVDGFVVGLSENQMAEKTKVFSAMLTQRFGLPVYFQDETLSSQTTRQQLAKQGVKRSKREAKTDHFVAASLLQEFIDNQV